MTTCSLQSTSFNAGLYERQPLHVFADLFYFLVLKKPAAARPLPEEDAWRVPFLSTEAVPLPYVTAQRSTVTVRPALYLPGQISERYETELTYLGDAVFLEAIAC